MTVVTMLIASCAMLGPNCDAGVGAPEQLGADVSARVAGENAAVTP